MASWEYTETELWRHGDGDVSLYHVFGLVSLKETVLAFAEARYGRGADAGEAHDLVMRRSEDGGRTFSNAVTVVSGEGAHCLTNPVPLADCETGRIFLFYCDNFGNSETRNYYLISENRGLDWSEPQEITDCLHEFSAPLKFHLFGPGHGIQLRNGLSKGRLIVPVWHRLAVTVPLEERNYCMSVLYSDDHGASWQQSAAFTGKECRANESRIEETGKGLLWVIRPAKDPCRWECRSDDGGLTWTKPQPQATSAANNCDAGLAAIRAEREYADLVVMSRVRRVDRREDMELLYSLDGGRTFPGRMALPTGDVMPGYSDLTVLEEAEPVLGLLHCRNNHVLFSRISLQTLTGGQYENTKRSVWL